MDGLPSLLQLCVCKLAQTLIKYGPKKVRYARLSGLPRQALEALLEILVARNALNDNVLPHALTPRTRKLGLEGACHLRRHVLNTIGRSCPNLRALDVRGCQQVDNRIVRDVLQYCEHLESLRLDGCIRISDSAFAPALWRPPLAGLLELRELSVGKCCQITAEGLMGYVMKGAPYIRSLALPYLRVSDAIVSELVFSFGLEVLDLSWCTQITDAPFQARSASLLRELHLAHTQVTDVAVEYIAGRVPELEIFDASYVCRFGDHGVQALASKCHKLRDLCICNTQITLKSFESIMQCKNLERLNASMCQLVDSRALTILAQGGLSAERPPIRELVLDHLGSLGLCGNDSLGPLPLTGLSLWETGSGNKGTPNSSPLILHWQPSRTSLEVESLSLPPADVPSHVQASEFLPKPRSSSDLSSPPLDPRASGNRARLGSSPSASTRRHTTSPGGSAEGPVQLPIHPSPLRDVVEAYALEKLMLDGVREMVDVSALEAIAMHCPSLQQLALQMSPGCESEEALEVQLRAIGSRCTQLATLSLDCKERSSHKSVVAALALPCFATLSSLSLCCSAKGGGLLDTELEAFLSGRTELKTLQLRNCGGISEGIFPRWCNRGERHDQALVVEQLDQVLLSSALFGNAGPSAASPSREEAFKRRSRRHPPRCPAAMALRSVTSIILGEATALSDASCLALAELVHDAQTVDVRGSPLLTEESLRAFKKGCRFLKLANIVTRDRTLSWSSATSAVKKHRLRTSRTHASGSSGTESN